MLKGLRRIAIGKPYEGKSHVRFEKGVLEKWSLTTNSPAPY